MLQSLSKVFLIISICATSTLSAWDTTSPSRSSLASIRAAAREHSEKGDISPTSVTRVAKDDLERAQIRLLLRKIEGIQNWITAQRNDCPGIFRTEWVKTLTAKEVLKKRIGETLLPSTDQSTPVFRYYLTLSIASIDIELTVLENTVSQKQ